jgi:hypothetical protein
MVAMGVMAMGVMAFVALMALMVSRGDLANVAGQLAAAA